MSAENVEIVRRLNEAVNRWDVEGVVELLDPDCEWWDREDDPGAAVHRGHEGISTFLSELDDHAEIRVEPKEFVDAGDFVVVPVRLEGRGRASGAPFEEHEVHVLKLQGGKVIEVREYRTKAEALKAVGLQEWAMSQKNVETVRRWVWAFVNNTDTFRELLHPDIEWMPFEDNNTPSHGLDGAMRIRNGWLGAWDEYSVEVHEILDAGGEDVFVGATLFGRGKTSGIGVDVHLYGHFKVRDGKVVYFYEYQDRHEALTAVGLEE